PASARTRRVWIHDAKPRVGQTIAEIQCRAAQVGNAVVIDKKFHAVALHYCVAVLTLIERHLVMQTGTAAFGHFYSQASARIFRSLRKQTPELSNSVVRDVNHCTRKYGCAVPKSKILISNIEYLNKQSPREVVEYLEFLNSCLFRISIFGFRISFACCFSSQSAIWNLQSEIQNEPDSIAP